MANKDALVAAMIGPENRETVDPNQKFDSLKDLGSRLNLAEGWGFRTKILDEELVFKTKDGKSFIVQDDIGNTYDRVGGPYSNYKP